MESDWSEEVFAEVRSVFHNAMGDDMNFLFTFLLPTGCGLKSLTKPALSSSFKWLANRARFFLGTTMLSPQASGYDLGKHMMVRLLLAVENIYS